METIYTVDEAAEKLKVDAQTIRRMLQQGRLQGRKLGKSWRIPEGALRSVVDAAPEAADNGNADNGNADNGNADKGNGARDETEALLDATGTAARRAEYKTEADIERLLAEVRAELGHDGPRRALREKRVQAKPMRRARLVAKPKTPTGASA
jgi:excisionase family DNA binding protein